MAILKKTLIIIIGIVTVVAFYQLLRRAVAEQRNNNVEIVADMEDFIKIANKTNNNSQDVMEKIKGKGVDSIAVSEKTLGVLSQNGAVKVYEASLIDGINEIEYKQIVEYFNDYINSNKIEKRYTTIILCKDEKISNFLEKSLKERFSNAVLTLKSADGIICGILLNRNKESILNVGLGIYEDDLIYAQSMGFTNIVPRLENYENISFEEIDRIYNMLKKYKVRTVIFNGVQVLGYDKSDNNNEKLKYIGKKFSQDGAEIITAILEKPAETDLETVQRGINKLSEFSNYKNTKVYSVDAAQLAKLSSGDMVNQWGRAISQRNVRIIYLRPLNVNYMSAKENLENTLNAISEIEVRIKYMGLKSGIAKGLGEIKENIFIKFSIAIGVLLGGIYLLFSLFSQKRWIYFILGLGVIAIGLGYFYPPLYHQFGNLTDKVIALGAAIIFPCLSATYLLEVYKKYSTVDKLEPRKLILVSLKVFVVTVLISVVGGIYVGAILSGSQYVLKLDTFRGVKISFILPILFFAFVYAIKIGVFTDKDGNSLTIELQLNKLLNTTITVKYAVAFGIVLLGLAVVLLRSGNNLVSSVSSIELTIRNLLEKYLVARPRTKELITLPVLMLTVFLSNHKFKQIAFFAGMLALIGVEDIVNSFCHIRMPVFTTTLSSIYSLIFGAIIGSILVIIVEKVIAKISIKED